MADTQMEAGADMISDRGRGRQAGRGECVAQVKADMRKAK